VRRRAGSFAARKKAGILIAGQLPDMIAAARWPARGRCIENAAAALVGRPAFIRSGFRARALMTFGTLHGIGAPEATSHHGHRHQKQQNKTATEIACSRSSFSMSQPP
jgi:hypothetical protein